MRMLVRLLGAAAALVVLVMLLNMIVSESGEVVVLQTADAAGELHDTRLWVVDYDGSAWLRSGSPGSGWYQRLLDDAEVAVRRGDQRIMAVAEPDVARRDAINELMAEKYGWADALIALQFGREDAIPVRLRPIRD